MASEPLIHSCGICGESLGATRALTAVTAERDRLRALLEKAGRALEPPSNGDWACAECKPYSDMLKPGFQCAYHAVKAHLATTHPRPCSICRREDCTTEHACE